MDGLHVGVAKAPVCNLPLLYTPCPCVVPIIRLPGTPPSGFASRHAAEWFPIRTEMGSVAKFVLGQNSKIGYQKFNGLQTAKRSKKQLCDRTKMRT
jgi:hypothetical protein